MLCTGFVTAGASNESLETSMLGLWANRCTCGTPLALVNSLSVVHVSPVGSRLFADPCSSRVCVVLCFAGRRYQKEGSDDTDYVLPMHRDRNDVLAYAPVQCNTVVGCCLCVHTHTFTAAGAWVLVVRWSCGFVGFSGTKPSSRRLLHPMLLARHHLLRQH